MRRPTRMAVAMHEAGHAVMRLIDPTSPVVAGIGLDTARGELGHVDTLPEWHPGHMDGLAPDLIVAEAWKRFARQDVSFYLAGPIAEMRWLRYSRSKIQWGALEMADRCLCMPFPTFGSDLDHVRRRLRWSDGSAASAAFITAWRATEWNVARWMPVIRRLADLVAESGELGGKDIDDFRRAFVEPYAKTVKYAASSRRQWIIRPVDFGTAPSTTDPA